MRFVPTEALPEIILIEPKVYRDERGFFLESYHAEKYRQGGITATFVQDNHSCSVRGVLRGLHYQKAPQAQGKLVRVVRGEVYDVAVDIRRGSPTRRGRLRRSANGSPTIPAGLPIRSRRIFWARLSSSRSWSTSCLILPCWQSRRPTRITIE